MASLMQLGIIVSLQNKFSAAATEIEKSADRIQQRIRNAGKSLSEFEEGIDKNQEKFFLKVGAAGYGLERFGAKTIGLAAKPIEAFEDLEAGTELFRAAMMRADGTVSPMFDKISKKVVDLSNKLPATSTDFFKVATLAKQYGMTEKEMLEGGLESATSFAVTALQNDYTRAIEMGTAIGNSWKIPQSDMKNIFDLMQRAEKGGANLGELYTAIVRGGGQAQSLGLAGFENLAAKIPYLGMLQKSTKLSGEVVGRGVSRIESKSLDEKAVKEASKMAGVQLKFSDSSGNYLGFENLVTQLEKLKDFKPGKMQEVLEKIYGEEYANIAKNLLIEGVKGAKEYANTMAAQSSLDQKLAVQLGTFSAKKEAFLGTLDTTLGKFGFLFEGPLKDGTDVLNSLAESMGEFTEKSPGLSRFLGYATIGVGSFAYVGGKMLWTLAGLGMAMPYIIKGAAIAGSGLTKFTNILTMHGQLATWQTGVLAAGAIAWSYVISELMDETSDLGTDARSALDSTEGFYASLKKLMGFFSYLGTYINPALWGENADKAREEIAQYYGADAENYAIKNKIGRYSQEAVNTTAVPKDIEKLMSEAQSALPSQSTSLTFAPSISIAAGANVDKEAIKAIIAEEKQKFFAEYEARNKRNSQLAYGGR